MKTLKITPRCKNSCIGPVCQKKLQFIAALPFDLVQNLQMASKMAMVRLCVGCPFRMFVLPNYALSPAQRAKYELLWKNRDIINPLLYGRSQKPEITIQPTSRRRRVQEMVRLKNHPRLRVCKIPKNDEEVITCTV